MQRYGHELDLNKTDDGIVAACRCGKWRVTVPAPPGEELYATVARAMRHHEQHVERVGLPPAGEPNFGK